MLAMIPDLIVTNNNPPNEEIPPPPQQAANATAHTDVQLEILHILQEMKQEYAGHGWRGGRGAGRGG